ncbi:phenylacetaldoxime dehydratase family protein [Rhodococcus zopfii]|uniref:phenylacetaldoxime dehydratase family protein n=1 Tax=Rhodococcus zopfii TaxID=43772 RepID=UPI00111126EF|nr:phenylacetaldoxime dehydratase family protein [Rhodococcus zopfii]
MTEVHPSTEPVEAADWEPDNYPGMVTRFPDEMTELVMGLFGIQSSRGEPVAETDNLRALLHSTDEGAAPVSFERAHFVDSEGWNNQIFVVYWTSVERYNAWWNSQSVQQWWGALDIDPNARIGYWREVLVTGADRHQYATGSTSPAGPSRFLPLEPSSKFGYWGAYRDRLAASGHDPLASSLDVLPSPVERATRGRRLRSLLPAGICYIREGQTWDECQSLEREVWETKMDPVVGEWVSALAENPVDTGCVSIRFCREQDVTAGTDLERQSQFGFLLSLGHIEKAARTNPAHLAVRGAFIDMYDNPRFTPQMNIWVEVHVPEPGGITAEYINCHPHTGFLPFFEVEELA